MDIKFKGSPNCNSREGHNIVAIVNHITAGSFEGAVSWLCNPISKASAHYVVSRKGEVVQLVRDGFKAWHAGAVNNPNWVLFNGINPNNITIGIEHEGYREAGLDGDLTESQYQATLALHKMLIEKHKILIDRDHIIGHYRIDSVNRPNCPGPKFPWDRLFADLILPKPKPQGPFLDVPVDHWAAESIRSVKGTSLMTGYLDGTFKPDAPVTRAELAVVLSRLNG